MITIIVLKKDHFVLQSSTENPRYNDSVCYQRFCCKIEFALIKKLDMDMSKARITDTFEYFFISHKFCVLESPQ